MAPKNAPLRQSLEEAWKARHSGTPTLEELWRFDLPIGRDRFAKAAARCEEVWKKPEPAAGARPGAGVNFVEISKVLEERFAEFNRYLREAMETPLDFFKILKWAAEPSIPQLRTKSLWRTVWEELYLLAVAHGRRKALSPAWNHLPTMDATVGLKALEAKKDATVGLKAIKKKKQLFDPSTTFVPGSKDWGFHPKDAELIYLPFLERTVEARWPNRRLLLLRARILMHHLGIEEFEKAQQLRRAATVYAKLRGGRLMLLDEIDVVDLSQTILDTDPFEAANRTWQTKGGRPGKYRIDDGEQDLFGVFWIDPDSPYRGTTAQSVYLELPPFPRHIFKTVDHGLLATMTQEQVFRLVGQSLTALGGFLLTYLTVVGFALDVITAGAASMTLRGLVYNFLKEKLIEAAVDRGLDAAKINSEPLRFLVQGAVGAKTGTAGKRLMTVEELESEARHVTFGRPKPPKPDEAAAAAGAGKETTIPRPGQAADDNAAIRGTAAPANDNRLAAAAAGARKERTIPRSGQAAKDNAKIRGTAAPANANRLGEPSLAELQKHALTAEVAAPGVALEIAQLEQQLAHEADELADELAEVAVVGGRRRPPVRPASRRTAVTNRGTAKATRGSTTGTAAPRGIRPAGRTVLDATLCAKKGISPETKQWVEDIAAEWRKQVALIKKKKNKKKSESLTSKEGTKAHEATQREIIKRHPETVAEQYTGVQASKIPKRSDLEEGQHIGGVLEAKQWAFIMSNGRLATWHTAIESGVETLQIQAYGIVDRYIKRPVFVITADGKVFTPDPDRPEGWIPIGWPE